MSNHSTPCSLPRPVPVGWTKEGDAIVPLPSCVTYDHAQRLQNLSKGFITILKKDEKMHDWISGRTGYGLGRQYAGLVFIRVRRGFTETFFRDYPGWMLGEFPALAQVTVSA